MSIFFLYAGGTIGMVPTARGLRPSGTFAAFLDRFLEEHFRDLEYTIRCFDPLIDSSEATPRHWLALAKAILSVIDRFDGVVIFHGTDTMAYTASALSFLLRGLAKPVVITGAQVPFGEAVGDARENILGAVRSLQDGQIKEVCIFFNSVLLRGNRSIKVSTALGDGFDTPHWPHLAELNSDFIVNRTALLRPEPALPALPKSLTARGSVGLLKIYPGVSARLLVAAAQIHKLGIVLELYGSGTAPVLTNDLRRGLATLVADGVPIVGVSQCIRGGISAPSYESSHLLQQLGVIPGFDLTPEAAVTKLTYLRSRAHGPGDLRAAVETALAGEITGSSQEH